MYKDPRNIPHGRDETGATSLVHSFAMTTTIIDSGPAGLRPSVVETSNITVKQQYVQDPIAVVGMACRLPGDSNTPAALWSFLERGGSADNEAPQTRFNLKAHHDGSKKPKTMRSPGGMFLEKIDPRAFDAQFFSISRTDAIAMDPQQRQLLEVVYESIENAGLRMENLDGAAFGCFVGSYAVGRLAHEVSYFHPTANVPRIQIMPTCKLGIQTIERRQLPSESDAPS